MSLQYGEDDDDLFDSTDEDEEENETEISADSGIKPRPILSQIARVTQQLNHSGGRRIRMRPMKPSMAAKHPNVVTILLTRDDGRQIMFVRK